METLTHTMGGLEWPAYIPDNDDDLRTFREWVETQITDGTTIGVDSEGTGLDIFSTGFRVRMVQFGNTHEAWLIPVEAGGSAQYAAKWALQHLPRMVLHNASFDALVFDKHLGVPLEEFLPKTRDTRVLAHLLDSRKDYEGGTGHSLKALSAAYVDPGAEDGQRELDAEFRAAGKTRYTGWATIPLDNPVYRRYAAADVVLVSRLLPELEQRCSDAGVPEALVEYEHRIARIGATVQRRGMRLDVAYTLRLSDELEREAQHFENVAKTYGVNSVNSPKQVAEALSAMGETLTEKTASGALAVGKEVLLPLADLNTQWQRLGTREPNKLADAVLRAKRAGKWRTSYTEAMLQGRDEHDHVHPSINTMGARTARWAVSNPPLQQLPSSDGRIRRCVHAAPGHTIVASDFAQVELRVLAALAGAQDLITAINEGEDLHSFVTRLVFNIPDDQPVPRDQRDLCKTISLGKAYAGGVRTLARQTGLPVQQVKEAVGKYDRALPAISRFARYLTRKAQQDGMTVRTPSGRTLHLDRDKSYSAIAYLCQSTARDILGQALIDIEDAGLLPYVIGVVHDEILLEVPNEIVDDVLKTVGECMDMQFFGIHIESEPEKVGVSWGHGHGVTD